jgi:hypothetical protein
MKNGIKVSNQLNTQRRVSGQDGNTVLKRKFRIESGASVDTLIHIMFMMILIYLDSY